VFYRPTAMRLSSASAVLTRARALRTPAGLPCSLVLALALAMGVVGCGSSDNGVASKPASEILAASRNAARGASSVRVSRKTKTELETSTSKLELGTNSGRAALSLLGLRFEVLRAGGALYLRGNQRFRERLGYKLGGQEGAAAAVRLPASTWVKVPAGNSSAAELGALTNISYELPVILHQVPVVKGHEITVNGQKAITLKETAKLFTGLWYIATTGEPYPIQFVTHGRQNGKTSFTGWNDPITLSAPTNTVDIRTLEGKAH
jgi:hypothetical protein